LRKRLPQHGHETLVPKFEIETTRRNPRLAAILSGTGRAALRAGYDAILR
jgi:hypothetical protein